MKCAKCGFDDNGTGDTAHICMTQAELNKLLYKQVELNQVKLRDLTDYEKQSISGMQQAIFSLEQAKEKIQYVRGNSDVGRCYIENIDSLIENLREDIDNIWEDQNA